MSLRWKKLDASILPHYRHLVDTDQCIFAREYVPGNGYVGDANQLIVNFKKEKARQGNPLEWQYRDAAVRRFAQEVYTIFKPGLRYTVTSIPSSKSRTDPDYDNRFEDMFAHLTSLHNGVVVEWPIITAQSVPSSHSGHGSRNPDTIKQNYTWQGFTNGEPEHLYVFDDVLTSGSHFRAFSNFAFENGFSGKIRGIVWARCI